MQIEINRMPSFINLFASVHEWTVALCYVCLVSVPVHLECVRFAVMEILFALALVFDRIQFESDQGFNA